MNMYQTVLLILYLLVLIPSITHLIRFRDVPSSRRISAVLGIIGVLLAPYIATLFCELLVSVFNIGLYVVIFAVGIGMLLKAVFR